MRSVADARDAELRGGPARTRRLVRYRSVDASPDVVWDAFLRVLWRGGAGLGPPPAIEDPGTPHGLGCTRYIALGGRRSIRERIVEVEHPTRLVYRVLEVAGGAYPVRAHVGVVRFFPIGCAGTRVEWTIRYVPSPRAWVVAALTTRFVVARYLRELEWACSSRERHAS